MEYLKKVQELFSGKKAYIVGILMIILGCLNADNATVLEGLAIIALRAGISKG